MKTYRTGFLVLSILLGLITISSVLSAQDRETPEVVLEAYSEGFYRPHLLMYSEVDFLFMDNLQVAEAFLSQLTYAIDWSGYVAFARESDSLFVGPDEIPRTDNPSIILRVKISGDSTAVRANLYLSEPHQSPYFSVSYSFTEEQVELYAEAAAEEVLRQITGMTAPFRSRIACVQRSEGNVKELVLVSWDGKYRWNLTQDGSIALSPSWNPDGKQIVFSSFRAGGDADLYIADFDQKRIRLLLEREGTDAAPTWSPKGDKIVFAGSSGMNTKLYKIDVSDGHLQKITTGRGIDTSPSWSPTGREIVFMSDRTGRPHIYRMDSDGANLRRLTRDGNYNADPSWSPSGDRIIYVRREEKGFQLRSMDLTGDVDIPLTDEPGDHLDPAWSPDGMKITYSYQGKIWVMNADGTRRRPLLADGLMPSWSPILK